MVGLFQLVWRGAETFRSWAQPPVWPFTIGSGAAMGPAGVAFRGCITTNLSAGLRPPGVETPVIVDLVGSNQFLSCP